MSVRDQATARAIIHEAMLLAPLPILAYQRAGRYLRRDGLAFHAYDPPIAALNCVAVADDQTPSARVLAEAAAWFADRPVWGLRVDGDLDLPVERAARAAGWALVEDEPNLVLFDPPATPPQPPPAVLTITHVGDDAALRDYLAVTRVVFGPTEPMPLAAPGPDGRVPTIDELLFPSLAAASNPDVALVLGRVAGAPVATAGVFRTGDVASIIGVTTLPAYRGRGYATALTWAAIGDGVRRGCRAAALGASAQGRPVYERMGFVFGANLRCYQAPGREGAGTTEGTEGHG